MTFVEEIVQRDVEAGDEGWRGLRGFGGLPEAEPLGETEGWRLGVGLWDLPKEGPEEDEEDVGVSVWVGVEGWV